MRLLIKSSYEKAFNILAQEDGCIKRRSLALEDEYTELVFSGVPLLDTWLRVSGVLV